MVFMTIRLIAQDKKDTTLRVFELGEVSISKYLRNEPVINLNRAQISRQAQNNLAETLMNLPGISLSRVGSRNESTIHLRGFDSRQIALLIDGIPVYISYDGNIDLGRFLSWNYEKISLSRGFSSLLYGPNSMGGTINLLTSLPKNKFEMDAYSGLMIGADGYNGLMENIRLGGRSSRFSYQAGLSYYNMKSWSTSGKYQDEKNLRMGRRDNSFENDLNANLRLVYSPKKDNDYAISYIRQDGSKGIPVYQGQIQSQRYWKMPEWDKESFYLSSRTTVGNKASIIGRIYLDKFYNVLESYDDSSYNSQTFRYAFSSIYDDKSYGGNLQYRYSGIQNNFLSMAFHFKRDVHSEQSGVELPFLEFSDNTFSLAVEDDYKISSTLNLITGLSWNQKLNTGSQEYFSGSDSIADMEIGRDQIMNFRLGLFYKAEKNHKFWITYAANSRFSSLKERYSYRLGRSLPNPDLGAERAHHFIAGYLLKYQYLSMNTELFYILSKNKIAYTNIDRDLIQYQNINKSVSYGTDIQLKLRSEMGYNFGVNYSYLRIENPEDENFKFIDIPKHNLALFADYLIKEKVEISMNYRFMSERYSYTDGSFSTDPYGLVDIGVNLRFSRELRLSMDIYNVFDKDYYYSEGYPAQGINARIGLRYTFE